MSHTIPASSITIDGPRAWWVRDPGVCDLCERFPSGHVAIDDCGPGHLDRSCGKCNGDGVLPDDGSVGMDEFVSNGGRRCRACDGTSRFTFEIEVAGEHGGIGAQFVSVTRPRYRVHVVRVFPIVTWYAGGDMPWPCFEMEPDVEVVRRWQRPADAEPGKFVVELAVHT
jgi:hypothetical protein